MNSGAPVYSMVVERNPFDKMNVFVALCVTIVCCLLSRCEGNLLLPKRWWVDLSPVEWAVQCHYPTNPRRDDSSSLCARTLQINCRPSSVRAVYQNVVLKSPANELALSVRANGEQLETAAVSYFLGMLATVELQPPGKAFVEVPIDTSRLAGHPSEEPVLGFASYRAPPNSTIQTVTVMVGCHGFVGSVYFSDMEALATFNGSQVEGSPCRVDLEKAGRKADEPRPLKPVYLLGEPHEADFGGLRDDISLVTQVSMDRLSVLEHTLDQWDMPVSLVIYAQLKGPRKTDDHWQRLYISKKVAGFKLHPSSVVSLVYASNATEQYPINSLRNMAIKQAHSRFLLLLDADFQPSPDLASRALPLMRSLAKKHLKPAVVIPAFEYADVPHKSDVVAANKQELMQLIHAQRIVCPFRGKEAPQSHAATDYWRWYRAREPYKIHLFSDMFEPYLLIEKNAHLPLYWEKFAGYGMNKISHMAELRIAGFNFWVSPYSWLIHVPHRLSTHFADHLQNATYRLANRALRFEFFDHLRVKYGLDCEDERAL